MNELQRQKLQQLASLYNVNFNKPLLSSWQSRVDHERQRIVGYTFRRMLVDGLTRLEAADWAYAQAVQFAEQHNKLHAQTDAHIRKSGRLTSLGYTLDIISFAEQAKTSVLVLTHFLED